ncbi:MAG: hypothetical protein IKW57_00865 [Alphaproteobacteria bacterium]|nr:hypothetical protein [Alphaproteobacteria bacterium]
MEIKNLMGYPKDYVEELISVVREQHRKFPEYEEFSRNILDSILRKASDCHYADYASRAALDIASKRGISLSDMTWDNQTAKKRDPGRKWFMRDHCVPIRELKDLVLNSNTPAYKIVKRETVAWITRAENACLDKKEYKDSRPGGWRKCYKECGIDVVKLKKT